MPFPGTWSRWGGWPIAGQGRAPGRWPAGTPADAWGCRAWGRFLDRMGAVTRVQPVTGLTFKQYAECLSDRPCPPAGAAGGDFAGAAQRRGAGGGDRVERGQYLAAPAVAAAGPAGGARSPRQAYLLQPVRRGRGRCAAAGAGLLRRAQCCRSAGCHAGFLRTARRP
ncbi:hypothetical protein G6F35_015741 [Rhizopus arrhizus]|nr:hypothetical protein G6F35_015741 [Rhizopus arrhizus]